MEEFKQTLHQTINPANAVEMRSASFTWESASEAFERGMRRSETKDSTMSEEEKRCLEEEGVTEALSEITLEVAKVTLLRITSFPMIRVLGQIGRRVWAGKGRQIFVAFSVTLSGNQY